MLFIRYYFHKLFITYLFSLFCIESSIVCHANSNFEAVSRIAQTEPFTEVVNLICACPRLRQWLYHHDNVDDNQHHHDDVAVDDDEAAGHREQRHNFAANWKLSKTIWLCLHNLDNSSTLWLHIHLPVHATERERLVEPGNQQSDSQAVRQVNLLAFLLGHRDVVVVVVVDGPLAPVAAVSWLAGWLLA